MDVSYLRQRSNPTWFQGDYNYDGVVNTGDFTVISAAYTSQTTHPLAAGTLEPALASFTPVAAATTSGTPPLQVMSPAHTRVLPPCPNPHAAPDSTNPGVAADESMTIEATSSKVRLTLRRQTRPLSTRRTSAQAYSSASSNCPGFSTT